MASSDDSDSIDLAVYLCLVVLTVVTVVSAQAVGGRILAVSLALGIASVKAALIGLYFMHLRHEGVAIHAIVWTGIVAVAILALGILPDAAWKL